MATKRKLSGRQYIAAIWQVARLTYRAAPLAASSQLLGVFITSIVPIVTTYFAARTTTALAAAYAGDHTAGSQAIIFVIVTALLGVLLMAWNSLSQYINQLMRYKVEAAVSDQMYAHFLNLDFWRYDDKDTADLYDRASDFARFFPYVFDRVAGLAGQFVTMVAGVVALILVSWWIGLIIIIAILPGIYFQFKLSRAQVAHRNAHVATRRSLNMLQWMLGNQRITAELRLYNTVKHLLVLRQTLRDKDEKARIDFERSFIIKRLGADLIETVAEISALVYTVLQIIARAQPIGQFIYVQQVVSRAIGGANGFVTQLSNLDEDLANLFDYQQFIELPERRGGSRELAAAPKTIELRHVSFHYPSSTTAVLTDVSLTVKQGQHVAIVGENGAGKSTLIKLLTGLYTPISGEVLIDNVNLETLKIESWHRQLAVLQQDAAGFYFMSAKDNIIMGDVDAPYSDERLSRAMKRAEAETFLRKLPAGVDSYVDPWMEDSEGHKGQDLSGGQWQRLALARNFYRDSPILILDEPTSAIDALAESRIFKHLFADHTHTLITISHRLTTVEKADIIYMFEAGKLVEQGTHSELVARKGAYYRMFESQLRA